MLQNIIIWEEYLLDGQLRVLGDAGSHYDAVTEGMRYGLLIALYCDDIATFDGLFKFIKAHAAACDLLYSNRVVEGKDSLDEITR